MKLGTPKGNWFDIVFPVICRCPFKVLPQLENEIYSLKSFPFNKKILFVSSSENCLESNRKIQQPRKQIHFTAAMWCITK